MAMADVARLGKVSFLKELQNIPRSVKMIARVLMMARSLTLRWVYPWYIYEYPYSADR